MTSTPKKPAAAPGKDAAAPGVRRRSTKGKGGRPKKDPPWERIDPKAFGFTFADVVAEVPRYIKLARECLEVDLRVDLLAFLEWSDGERVALRSMKAWRGREVLRAVLADTYAAGTAPPSLAPRIQLDNGKPRDAKHNKRTRPVGGRLIFPSVDGTSVHAQAMALMCNTLLQAALQPDSRDWWFSPEECAAVVAHAFTVSGHRQCTTAAVRRAWERSDTPPPESYPEIHGPPAPPHCL